MLNEAMPRLSKALAKEMNQLSIDFYKSIGTLLVSLQLRISIGIGILALMTMKTDMVWSVVITASALGIGIIISTKSLISRKAVNTKWQASEG